MNSLPLFRVRCDEDRYRALSHECFATGYIGEGPLVKRFEEQLASILRVPAWSVLAVNSGTSALQLALALCGVEPSAEEKGEVVMSPVTCTADPNAVLGQGGSIVWCDAAPRTGLLDPAHAERLVTGHTKAIIATDWGGTTPKIGSHILGVPVIEDAAHNLTGRHYGSYVALSFQAIKHLTTADGGALVVHDEKKAAEGRLRRWFGLDRSSSADFRCAQTVTVSGLKWHMADLDAALGLANIDLALDSIERSRENARWYQDNLPEEVLVPFEEESPYWIYTILVENRDQSEMPMADGFKNFMAARGIVTSPVHAICTKHRVFPRTPLPGAEWFCARNTAIPNGWWVTPKDRERVAGAANDWVRMGQC